MDDIHDYREELNEEAGAPEEAVLIAAKCKEDDIYTVKRVMNKEVLKIFYKYGINVPFPHVTVTRKEKI